LEHPWFEITKNQSREAGAGQSIEAHTKIIQRLKDFRAPQRLQMEALTFLVNNLGSGVMDPEEPYDGLVRNEIDFKQLREAFRTLDTENLGMLSIAEVK